MTSLCTWNKIQTPHHVLEDCMTLPLPILNESFLLVPHPLLHPPLLYSHFSRALCLPPLGHLPQLLRRSSYARSHLPLPQGIHDHPLLPLFSVPVPCLFMVLTHATLSQIYIYLSSSLLPFSSDSKRKRVPCSPQAQYSVWQIKALNKYTWEER